MTIDPNNTEALDDKGGALDNTENYTQAIAYFDKALVIDPNYENALYNKGAALESLGNYAKAIQYYNKALVIDPKDKNALNAKQSALSYIDNTTSNTGNNMTLTTPPCDPAHSLC